MPYACPKPCRHPGCGNLVASAGFCPTHQAARHKAYNAARNDQALYRTAAWRRLREAVLREEPFCRVCEERGDITPSTIADHLVPVKQGGAFFDRANLQGVCNLCHERKSYQEGSRFTRAPALG